MAAQFRRDNGGDGGRTSEAEALPPTATMSGLSEAEASARLANEGGNACRLQRALLVDIIRRNLFTFINITLLVVGVVLVAMGLYRDALLASGLAVVNGLAGVFQETRAKRRLDQIALLNRSHAIVVRDGVERALDPEQIVRGDILRLRAGDQVFADGTVVGDSALAMDESLLTGESDPVAKHPGDRVSSGSFCISGSGWYQADRVGAANTVAKMTAGARAYRVPLTPLQIQVNLIVRLLLVVAAFFLVTVLLGSLIWGYPVEETVLAAAVVLGIVPSGLFLMIIVTYSMGAVRLANQDALVQGRMPLNPSPTSTSSAWTRLARSPRTRCGWPRCSRLAPAKRKCGRCWGRSPAARRPGQRPARHWLMPSPANSTHPPRSPVLVRL